MTAAAGEVVHPKLRVNGVSMWFDELHVLDDISFEMGKGDFVALLGPSGCGKSTLLNLVAGLLTPTGGTMHRDDMAVEAPGPDRSMVFQDDAVFPWYTVVQNVEYGMRMKGIEKDERRANAQSYIDLVGLTGREDAYPFQLSGGMKKRVDVARALAAKPDVLLMDEPFASLDAMTKSRLQTEFLHIWEDTRVTVLFVTHDVEEALFLSERILVMSTGPGRLFFELDVPFSHPREVSLRTSPEFQGRRAELFDALHRAGAEF